MTIDELKNKLHTLPKEGAINKARRAAILRQIREKEKAENEHD